LKLKTENLIEISLSLLEKLCTKFVCPSLGPTTPNKTENIDDHEEKMCRKVEWEGKEWIEVYVSTGKDLFDISGNFFQIMYVIYGKNAVLDFVAPQEGTRVCMSIWAPALSALCL
jgi:hypothetical protein